MRRRSGYSRVLAVPYSSLFVVVDSAGTVQYPKTTYSNRFWHHTDDAVASPKQNWREKYGTNVRQFESQNDLPSTHGDASYCTS